jgi:hypothetical protein
MPSLASWMGRPRGGCPGVAVGLLIAQRQTDVEADVRLGLGVESTGSTRPP